MRTKNELARLDYYDTFRCKCGACNNSCCEGWTVSIGMDEYFRLIGMECSEELRKKLDIAFHLTDDGHRDENRYAQITPLWNGECPLHGEDGLCMLQKECGAEALPRICRQYPRKICLEHGEEALSNSCEGVVETLIKRDNPLVLCGEFACRTDDCDCYAALRKKCIALLQDRRFPVADRIKNIGQLLTFVQKKRDSGKLTEEGINRFVPSEDTHNLDDYRQRIRVQLTLLAFAKENSLTEQPFCKKALNVLCYGKQKPHFERVNEIYNENRKKLYEDFPKMDIYLEQILVNHLFFDQFPFSDSRENFVEEYDSLCATYGYIMALAVGCVDDYSTEDKFVMLIASAFRMISHTKFDHNMLVLMKYLGCLSRAKVNNLLNA